MDKIKYIKEIILDIINDVRYKQKTYDELLNEVLKVSNIDSDITNYFDLAISELIDEYQLFKTKDQMFNSQRQMNRYVGVFTTKSLEFGFITNQFYPDVYCSHNDFSDAMNKDLVLYDIVESGYDRCAVILKVIKRNKEYLVGVIHKQKSIYILECQEKGFNYVVFVKNTINAKVNDIVRVKINRCKINTLYTETIDVLSNTSSIDKDVILVASRFGVYNKFSDDVISACNDLYLKEDEEGKRVKYKNKIFTIDDDEAKDLDDAVSIKKLDNGNYELGVYIADVSYYVKEESIIDIEALKRGTSCYLLDTVIPMLPIKLSNDLCSLNPNEEKLVISCIMEVNSKGEVVSSKIEEGIIKTTKRLSYSKCNDVLMNGLENNPDYSICLDELNIMQELMVILQEKREKRGALDFDTIEPKIVLNSKKEAIDIVIKPRGISERIIEEFMILCNETVCEYISNLQLPFIYRVHEKVDNIKFQMLRSIVKNLGYTINSLHPKEFQKLLSSLDEKDMYLNNSILRLMNKAIYSEENIGHFGLASLNYTHFTSPIRRYPDLLVHRLIRKYLFNNEVMLSDEEFYQLQEKIRVISKSCSDSERKAMESEYAIIDMKKAEYMANFIGLTFDGVVTSIHKFGVFVELKNTVDGLISAFRLNSQSYYYDEYKMEYCNRRTKEVIKVGDNLKVRLENSNKKNSEIDFELVYNNTRKKKYYGKYKSRHKK